MGIKSCRLGAAIVALAVIALAGCQTKPEIKASGSVEVSTIQAESRGFAPMGDEHFRTIRLALLFGNSEAVQSWSVKIAAQKKAVRSFSGSGSDLPESLLWDGKDDGGAQAAEGSYTAALVIDYGTVRAPGNAVSKAFILDITSPSGSFSPNPAQFGYSPEGVKAPISIAISAKPALAAIAAWAIDISDPEGTQVKSLAGDWPGTTKASWDGMTDQGRTISANVAYTAILTIRDEFGNSGKYSGSFSVAAAPVAKPSAISARRSGFSPTSASVKSTIDLVTTFGSKESVTGWKVSVMSVTAGPIRAFVGDGSKLPEFSRWDGMDESGVLAGDGSYYTTLSVDYGKSYKPSMVRGASFSLVTSPPSGSITVNPPNVALAELGPKKPINLIVEAKAPFAQISSWTMSVLDSSGTALAVFHSNWPDNKAAWDGKTIAGGFLSPGATYAVVAKVQDEYGNVGELKGILVAAGLPAPTEPSAISALLPGFAPTGDKSPAVMGLKLEFGNRSSMSAWRVDMVGSDGTVQRSFEGTGANARSSFGWDGKNDNGKLAPEGVYTARLNITYGLSYSPIAVSSAGFVLDLTPPEVAVKLSTELFSPGGEGGSPTVTISLEAKSPIAKLTNWSIRILDPADLPFADFKGAWASRAVDWNGKGMKGDLVESASDYTVVARVQDEYGNVGEVRKTLPIDILVMKTGDGYRIRVSSIVFKGFTADYTNVMPDRAARNVATLNLLAKKLALFPDYDIRLQGYAVMINWENKAAGEMEQKEILLPLSKARAEAIKAALSERGIGVARLSTFGLGADDPVVPNGDYLNRWKNRRVEFYIVK